MNKQVFLQTIWTLCYLNRNVPTDWKIEIVDISEDFISIEARTHSDYFNSHDLIDLANRFNIEVPEVTGDYFKEFSFRIRNNQEEEFDQVDFNYLIHNSL